MKQNSFCSSNLHYTNRFYKQYNSPFYHKKVSFKDSVLNVSNFLGCQPECSKNVISFPFACFGDAF